MKESHRKGVASHPDPESCVASRKAAIEALTGAHAGRVLSCEIIASGVPTSYHVAEGNTAGGASASRPWTLRSPETPGMRGNSTHENRETPSMPIGDQSGGSAGEGHEPDVQHARRWGVGRSRSTDERARTKTGNRRRRAWREGDRPRRTPSSRPRPGHRAGAASRADCAVCEKSHARTSEHGSPRCCTTSRSSDFRKASTRSSEKRHRESTA